MFSRLLQVIIAIGAGIALFSVLSTGMYYVMPVTSAGLAICAVVAVGLIIVIPRSSNPPPLTRQTGFRMTTALLLFISLVSLTFWWHAVLTHPIVESIRSPWLAIDPSNLITLFVPFVIGVVLFNKSRTASFLIFVLTIFSALSLVAVAYPLGYGFDPFLHRATIQHIADYGTITPKPLYYIGEYMIELFALKILHLPLFLVDVYLVPLLASILIPTAVFVGMGSGSETGSIHGSTPTAMLVLLFLPLSTFIQTTPQALAFVFTAVVIFLTAPELFRGPKDGPTHWSAPTSLALPGIFALAALVAHPLAGLSAVFYVAMIAVASLKFTRGGGVKTPALAVGVVACVSAVALPMAFMVQSIKAHLPLGFALPTLGKISSLPLTAFLGTHFNAWGDTAYLVIGNLFLVTVGLGIFGAWRMRGAMGTRRASSVRQFIPLIAAGIAFANFLILGLFFDFPFLIAYERADFAGRMLTLTALFLLPYVPDALRRRGGSETLPYATQRTFTTIIIGIVFVSSVYGAYPRYDAYASSAGFNVTKADVEAVQAIEKYAAGRDYVVLANQATSSSAISELGFKKYYHGDMFFYPIPTGGPLYQLFLTMSSTPNKTTIEKAREITGAHLVFFVMSDYWWDANRVIEQTKPLADAVWTFENGNVTVMVFEK
ncbi:MAG: hypothetical protein WC802_04545 [Patescibacteria group bacterium]|jgi:hypothetical protein